MSNTNRALSTNGRMATRENATGFGVDRTAIIGMSTGIARPASVQRKMEDIARGRTVNAWAHVPEIAEACIDSGGSIHHILRPLTAMAAHVKRRFGNKLSRNMKTALTNLNRECDEAKACALSLAFDANNPSVLDLIALDKESDEAILALEHAKELAEDLLAAREQS